jgi:hypothetical protein
MHTFKTTHKNKLNNKTYPKFKTQKFIILTRDMFKIRLSRGVSHAKTPKNRGGESGTFQAPSPLHTYLYSKNQHLKMTQGVCTEQTK